MRVRELSRHQRRVADFYGAAIARDQAVALWRQPGASTVVALSAQTPEEIRQVSFAAHRPGFVFAPFAEERPSLFLPADHLLDQAGLHNAPGVTPLDLDGARPQSRRWHPAPDAADSALDEPAFEALVADAIAFIRSAQIAKVVVSRTAPVALPPGFDPVALFNVLCRRHPSAFVSLVTLTGIGAWLGASPELLLRMRGQELSTVALAGTRARPAGSSLAAVDWGAKERAEQEMVSAYIRTVFEEAGAPQVNESAPATIAAGGMVHLQTRFDVHAHSDDFPELADRVLERLHPTSAVCGMPRNEALQFIRTREGYDRGFYSGYLGPVNLDGSSTLYVNLRCMQLRTNSGALYVGAGVTAGSDPASEWRETELKACTILDALAETASASALNIDATPTPDYATLVAV